MDFNMEQEGAVGVLTIDGELTIQRAGELKTILMKSLDSVDHLVLNLEGVTDIDLSCFQLLCSAHRTSSKLRKQLTLANNRLDIFKSVTETAGFPRKAGCSHDCDKDCPWIGGGD